MALDPMTPAAHATHADALLRRALHETCHGVFLRVERPSERLSIKNGADNDGAIQSHPPHARQVDILISAA